MARLRGPCGLSLLLAALLGPGPAQASVSVDVSVAQGAPGQFDYQVDVMNGLSDDVALVILIDAPPGDAVVGASATAPLGHAILYDPALGLVDLLEDSQPFAAGTGVTGFAFSSVSAPASGVFERFEAYTVEGELVEGSLNVVPEPRGVALGAAGVALLALLRRRRARCTTHFPLPTSPHSGPYSGPNAGHPDTR